MVLGHTGTCTLLMLMTGVTAKEEARQVWMVSKEVLDRAREVRLSLVLAGTGTGLMLMLSKLVAKEVKMTAMTADEGQGEHWVFTGKFWHWFWTDGEDCHGGGHGWAQEGHKE